MEKKCPIKIPKIFSCDICHYNTSNKKDYNKHCFTPKHINGINGNNQEINKSPQHLCICGKIYKSYSGLWKHKNTCVATNNSSDTYSNHLHEITPELILKVIEQNKELTNIILQQNTTINKLCDSNNNTNITNNNNTQINNSENNKTFNLNFYLNETCKNAMNIDEFVDNIKLSLEDLEYTGRKGYIEGITNIILKNLNRLEEYDRPIHCSDGKRQTLYIKRDNTWTKEEGDKPILTKAIKAIANENIKQISKWSEKNPDCKKSYSKKNDLYLQIVSNSMCGIDKEESEKNINKIISNITKHVTINKK
jgi:hypothetical protein